MDVSKVIILAPPIELTEATVPEFENELMSHLDTPGPGVVVDLGGVEFISSSGLGVLVKAGMRLDARGRCLAFARAQRTTEHSLRLLGLDRKMPLLESLEEATAHVAQAAEAKSG
jgi:anti-sigma B factor antagonist